MTTNQKQIVITVSGGLVQHVEYPPAYTGPPVVIRDYDETDSPDRDGDGNPYRESYWSRPEVAKRK
jgi:hypothetical protein